MLGGRGSADLDKHGVFLISAVIRRRSIQLVITTNDAQLHLTLLEKFYIVYLFVISRK